MTDLDVFFVNNDDLRSVADYVVAPPSIGDLLEEFESIDTEVLERCQETVTYGGVPITRGTLYAKSRRGGADDRFAAVCAMQKCQTGTTDDTFWGGRPHFSELYGERYANEVKALVEAQGGTLGAHDEYMPELADYKGDLKAVVSRSQGRSHIKRVCEMKGVACEGAVTVKGREPLSDPLAAENCVPMADKLIAECSQSIEPDQRRKMTTQDIRDHVIDKYGPK